MIPGSCPLQEHQFPPPRDQDAPRIPPKGPTPTRRIRDGSNTSLYLPHFLCFRFASALSSPFSRSSGRSRGVGGTSLSRDRPLRDSLTDDGNSDRRGVRAVTTLRADFLRASFTFHSRFLATKKRMVVEIPTSSTTTTTTMMAIMPPLEMETEFPVLSPEAPASVPSRSAVSLPYGFSEANGNEWLVADAMMDVSVGSSGLRRVDVYDRSHKC